MSTNYSLLGLCAFFVVMMVGTAPAPGQLRGHGGPVRALAISPDGATAVSGSFDSAAIRWSLARDAAEQVFRFHEGAVNAVAWLKDGRIASAGEDGRIAVWSAGRAAPDAILAGHKGPIAALAAMTDGAMLASGSWDHTVRLWPLTGGPPRVLEGHQQNVNGVAVAPDGRSMVSVGYDATVRIWPLDGSGPPVIVTLTSPLNAVAVAPDGEIVAASADGRVYFIGLDGAVRGSSEPQPDPLVALALSPDGARIATGGIRGSVAVIDRLGQKLERLLVGPGLPVWSVAFLPDHRTVLTGGADGVIRRWNAASGEPVGSMLMGGPADPLADFVGDPGAQVFRACVACHTLHADETNRAGPTLHGIFGRRIATQPGYNYSEALKRLDIVWTPQTIARLLELGPAAYTPGTKMPEQRIGSPRDRDALVKFLERAAR